MEEQRLQPWIELKVGIRSNFKGFDQLEDDLKSIGSIHKRIFWHTAAGSDDVLDIILKFGENIIVNGLIWDLCKGLIFRLLNNLKEFYKRNVDCSLSCLKIEYDDITFSFVEIPSSKINHIGEFFNRLPKHLEFFKKHDIVNIDEIEINSYYSESVDDPNDDNLFRFWKIGYDFGMNIVQYDSENHSFPEIE